MPRLPNAADIVSVESAVAADQRQTFDLGLSCEHAVERVAVVMRQLVYGERVRQADLQHLEAIYRDLLMQALWIKDAWAGEAATLVKR